LHIFCCAELPTAPAAALEQQQHHACQAASFKDEHQSVKLAGQAPDEQAEKKEQLTMLIRSVPASIKNCGGQCYSPPQSAL
jgi:hypothetical protein